MKIDVQTQATSDGLITQEISTELGNVHDVLVRQVISTQDAQVREALIKLGWVPPGMVVGADPVAWRWKEKGRWFEWQTDWMHHERAKEAGCEIEYAYAMPADVADYIGWLKRETKGWKAHAESTDRQLKEAREEVQRLSARLIEERHAAEIARENAAAPQPPTASPEQESIWQPSTALQTEPIGKVVIGTVSDEDPSTALDAVMQKGGAA